MHYWTKSMAHCSSHLSKQISLVFGVNLVFAINRSCVKIDIIAEQVYKQVIDIIVSSTTCKAEALLFLAINWVDINTHISTSSLTQTSARSSFLSGHTCSMITLLMNNVAESMVFLLTTF